MATRSRGVIDYERSVFINCPFDKDCFPLLSAMLWPQR